MKGTQTNAVNVGKTKGPIKSRNRYIDILKAVTIILVVIGHCVQCGSGNTYLSEEIFFYNPLFIVIYSFHMPLFMLISGYLFAFSSGKKWTDVIQKKFYQLIVPLFFWSFISLFISISKCLVKGTYDTITLMWMLKKLASGFINGPWFLWSIWWCAFAVIITKTFLKDNILVYLFGFILTFVIPDAYGCSLYKFMYPFFLFGYFFNAYDLKTKLKKIYMNPYFSFLVFVVFVGLLLFYRYDSYIYTSGYTIIGKDALRQIYNDMFRMIIGLFGSLAMMYLVYFACKLPFQNVGNIMVYIGTNTLGIYVISGYFFNEVLVRIAKGLPSINYGMIAVEAVLILVVSLLVNNLLKSNRITNAMFLGGR